MDNTIKKLQELIKINEQIKKILVDVKYSLTIIS